MATASHSGQSFRDETDCAKDKVCEFLFRAPPLVITGGTGSTLNPYAVK